MVLCNGKLAGIVSIGDVVKHRLDDLELEVNLALSHVKAGFRRNHFAVSGSSG
jgi:hypothetical protein